MPENYDPIYEFRENPHSPFPGVRIDHAGNLFVGGFLVVGNGRPELHRRYKSSPEVSRGLHGEKIERYAMPNGDKIRRVTPKNGKPYWDVLSLAEQKEARRE